MRRVPAPWHRRVPRLTALPPRGRAVDGMRHLLLALALLGGPLAACQPDPGPQCARAYEHLVEIAGRQPSDDERRRFVDTCRGAWDEGRHRCLMGAETVQEALDCRPTRVPAQ